MLHNRVWRQSIPNHQLHIRRTPRKRSQRCLRRRPEPPPLIGKQQVLLPIAALGLQSQEPVLGRPVVRDLAVDRIARIGVTFPRPQIVVGAKAISRPSHRNLRR